MFSEFKDFFTISTLKFFSAQIVPTRIFSVIFT